jgi:hypothetical protein
MDAGVDRQLDHPANRFHLRAPQFRLDAEAGVDLGK